MKPLIGITAANDGAHQFCINRAYCDAILRAGGVPVLLPPCIDPAEAFRLDGILLSGGGDIDPRLFGLSDFDPQTVDVSSPERDAFELMLARLAYQRNFPTFGICRGIQVMNAALGGTLFLDIPHHLQVHARKYPSHVVRIRESTRLRAIMGEKTAAVNSIHHQAVDRIAGGLRVCAVSDDGIVEALEAPDKRFYLGVQWHPEHLAGAGAILSAFVQASSKK